ncbi:cell division protein CrgA [Phytoactinopolyspora halotolerans]|uniref:Cell division protein CrgA n=1 Tax=Phytoactinopolyspora halotolerans TaxID=1981512 RepID=A0A6L9S105_9ACTN|nr:cell division protein CrgA [Phytoactinopolyspora halotolerans]NED98716.1 cell division protein CrgA [Phytoactinopolyspora halotolerans]
MPSLRRRKKDDSVAPERRDNTASGRWVVPTMLTLLILGLVWIVVYYLLREEIGFMETLGGWNLVIGMGLITGGFITATQWK